MSFRANHKGCLYYSLTQTTTATCMSPTNKRAVEAVNGQFLKTVKKKNQPLGLHKLPRFPLLGLLLPPALSNPSTPILLY